MTIIRYGRIVFSKAYGLANIQDSVPVTPHTRFSINSISKAFTGVTIMQLAEDHKITLESPVSDYLDSLPPDWRSVTLRQLLSHISGLPNILGYDNERIIREGEEQAAWTAIQKAPLQFARGERFSYNQTNYVLLGKIINKYGGMDFVQYIQRYQLDRDGHPAIAAIGGGRAALFMYPKDDLSIVILTNLQGASPELLIDPIASFYFSGHETH